MYTDKSQLQICNFGHASVVIKKNTEMQSNNTTSVFK
jgi:hypothetical protein